MNLSSTWMREARSLVTIEVIAPSIQSVETMQTSKSAVSTSPISLEFQKEIYKTLLSLGKRKPSSIVTSYKRELRCE